MQDEVLELHVFYASSRALQPAARVVAAMAERTEKWVNSTSSGQHGSSSSNTAPAVAGIAGTMGRIKEHGIKYGAGLEVSSSVGRRVRGSQHLSSPSAAMLAGNAWLTCPAMPGNCCMFDICPCTVWLAAAGPMRRGLLVEI